MRNSKDIADTASNFKFNVAGSAIDSSSLRDGAMQESIAPTSHSGCVSEISSDTIRGRKHDYTAAMKNYGVVYEEYQSYLMPMEQTLPHDYDAAARPVPAFGHLGCLNADLFDSTVQADEVSDDDIESCGYIAWVRH